MTTLKPFHGRVIHESLPMKFDAVLEDGIAEVALVIDDGRRSMVGEM